MKTDDLIKLLAEDAPVRIRFSRLMAISLVVSVLLSGAILLSTVGIRPHMASAFETTRVLFKIGFALVLAITTCSVVLKIGRPGVSMRASALALFLPLVLIVCAVGIELDAVPSSAWRASLVGNNSGFCLMFIPVLSLAPLAGFMLALKNGAPEHPALAGATAGLAAGSIAAALYVWHCSDDSPLFVATWYTIAIAIVTTLGGLIGRRYLRW